MNVLVTGANGFIGQALCKRLMESREQRAESEERAAESGERRLPRLNFHGGALFNWVKRSEV